LLRPNDVARIDVEAGGLVMAKVAVMLIDLAAPGAPVVTIEVMGDPHFDGSADPSTLTPAQRLGLYLRQCALAWAQERFSLPVPPPARHDEGGRA
jgi:hypothetical protein